MAAKKTTKKKTAKKAVKKKIAKKPVAKKPVAKKPVAKKPVAKKPVAKKPVAKKPVAKKSAAKKPAAIKSAAKKPAAKKPAAKKPAAKKAVTKEASSEKPVAKKAIAKKAAAKEAAPRSAETKVAAKAAVEKAAGSVTKKKPAAKKKKSKKKVLGAKSERSASSPLLEPAPGALPGVSLISTRVDRPVGKNRKLTTRQLQKIRAVLTAKQRDLTQHQQAELSKLESPDRRSSGDPDEVSGDTDGTDSLCVIMDIESAQIEQIDKALQKIDNGTYGVCEDCGEEISPARLEALPFASQCIECKRKAEIANDFAARALF